MKKCFFLFLCISSLAFAMERLDETIRMKMFEEIRKMNKAAIKAGIKSGAAAVYREWERKGGVRNNKLFSNIPAQNFANEILAKLKKDSGYLQLFDQACSLKSVQSWHEWNSYAIYFIQSQLDAKIHFPMRPKVVRNYRKDFLMANKNLDIKSSQAAIRAGTLCCYALQQIRKNARMEYLPLLIQSTTEPGHC